MRMGYDAEGAINVLKDGLKPERTHSFVQADMLVSDVLDHCWLVMDTDANVLITVVDL